MRLNSLTGAAIVTGLLLSGATPISAKESQDSPQSFRDVIQCRTIANDAKRLACFDHAVKVMADAEESGSLVTLDQKQIAKTKRSLFGLPISKEKLFGNKGEAGKELDNIEGTVKTVSRDISNNLIFTLKDGARWVQIGGRSAYTVHPGTTVKIKKALLGSYFANFGHGLSIRVRREQ